LTIEKWKAEQQLPGETYEPTAAVPVNSVRLLLSGSGRTRNICEQPSASNQDSSLAWIATQQHLPRGAAGPLLEIQ
jgi:hypothetical protein